MKHGNPKEPLAEVAVLAVMKVGEELLLTSIVRCMQVDYNHVAACMSKLIGKGQVRRIARGFYVRVEGKS